MDTEKAWKEFRANDSEQVVKSSTAAMLEAILSQQNALNAKLDLMRNDGAEPPEGGTDVPPMPPMGGAPPMGGEEEGGEPPAEGAETMSPMDATALMGGVPENLGGTEPPEQMLPAGEGGTAPAVDDGAMPPEMPPMGGADEEQTPNMGSGDTGGIGDILSALNGGSGPGSDEEEKYDDNIGAITDAIVNMTDPEAQLDMTGVLQNYLTKKVGAGVPDMPPEPSIDMVEDSPPMDEALADEPVDDTPEEVVPEGGDPIADLIDSVGDGSTPDDILSEDESLPADEESDSETAEDSEKESTEEESDEDEDEDEDESPIKKSAKSDDEKESDNKKSSDDKKDGDDKDNKTDDKESESDDKKSDKKSDEKSSDKKSKSDEDDEESSDSFADRFFSTDDDESDEESDDEPDDVPVSDDEDVPDEEIDIEEEPLEESDVAAIEEVIGKKMSELIDTVREMLGGEADTDVNPMIAEGTVDLNPGTDPFCACDTPEAMDSLTRSIDDLMNDRLKGLRGYDGKMYKVVKSEAEIKREKTEQLKRSLGSKAVYHMTGEEVLNAINGLTGGDLETIRKSSSYLYPYDIIVRSLDRTVGPEKTDCFMRAAKAVNPRYKPDGKGGKKLDFSDSKSRIARTSYGDPWRGELKDEKFIPVFTDALGYGMPKGKEKEVLAALNVLARILSQHRKWYSEGSVRPSSSGVDPTFVIGKKRQVPLSKLVAAYNGSNRKAEHLDNLPKFVTDNMKFDGSGITKVSDWGEQDADTFKTIVDNAYSDMFNTMGDYIADEVAIINYLDGLGYKLPPQVQNDILGRAVGQMGGFGDVSTNFAINGALVQRMVEDLISRGAFDENGIPTNFEKDPDIFYTSDYSDTKAGKEYKDKMIKDGLYYNRKGDTDRGFKYNLGLDRLRRYRPISFYYNDIDGVSYGDGDGQTKRVHNLNMGRVSPILNPRILAAVIHGKDPRADRSFDTISKKYPASTLPDIEEYGELIEDINPRANVMSSSDWATRSRKTVSNPTGAEDPFADVMSQFNDLMSDYVPKNTGSTKSKDDTDQDNNDDDDSDKRRNPLEV